MSATTYMFFRVQDYHLPRLTAVLFRVQDYYVWVAYWFTGIVTGIVLWNFEGYHCKTSNLVHEINIGRIGLPG